MVGNIPEPFQVPRIALRMCFLHAAARNDPFEHRSVIHREYVAQGFEIGDSVTYPVNSI